MFSFRIWIFTLKIVRIQDFSTFFMIMSLHKIKIFSVKIQSI